MDECNIFDTKNRFSDESNAVELSWYDFFFIGITFEIEFHECVVLCDLTNFDRIKKSTFKAFCRVSERIFILLSLIGHFVDSTQQTLVVALCVTMKTHLTTLPSPRGANRFHSCETLSLNSAENLFYWFYFPALRFILRNDDGKLFSFVPNQLRDLSNSHQTSTLTNVSWCIKLKAMVQFLNWETRDFTLLACLRVHAFGWFDRLEITTSSPSQD